MPGRAPCQFNLNQFDKSDTLSGQQPTAHNTRFLLLGPYPRYFSCRELPQIKRPIVNALPFCWQHNAGEKQELQFERQGKCNTMCFPSLSCCVANGIQYWQEHANATGQGVGGADGPEVLTCKRNISKGVPGPCSWKKSQKGSLKPKASGSCPFI